MELQEYKQKLEAHLLTFDGLDVELIKNIVLEITYVNQGILSCIDIVDIVSGSFDWVGSQLGREYWWNTCYELKRDRKPAQKLSPSLTKSDAQYLLSELRDTLSVVTELKNEFKYEANHLWKFCDKDDPSTQESFQAFSRMNSGYMRHKKQESKLTALIKKVKHLQRFKPN